MNLGEKVKTRGVFFIFYFISFLSFDRVKGWLTRVWFKWMGRVKDWVIGLGIGLDRLGFSLELVLV